MSVSKIVAAAASGVGGAGLDVDEVFSTFLYDGTGSAQTITNNIDLSSEGGLVWIKRRDGSNSHNLEDTARGAGKSINSDTSNAEDNQSGSYGISAFNSNGFSLVGAGGRTNTNNAEYVSWTFRKAPKFFDVVTYTGTGGSRTLNHNLNSTIGMIIVKDYSNAGENWTVYHRGIDVNGDNAPETDGIYLNTTGAAGDESGFWNDTAPTSTQFTVGGNLNSTFGGGANYVAYLFAHNDSGDGGFGPDGDADIIKSGSYTGNGSSTGPSINLGFEPQWVMIKRASGGTGGWFIFDAMRGIVTGGNDSTLQAESSGAEGTGDNRILLTATGFQIETTSSFFNNSGDTYIYMAIRRGPLAAPDDATKVFSVSGSANSNVISTGFNVDMNINTTTNAQNNHLITRLMGNKSLKTNDTSSETDRGSVKWFDDLSNHINLNDNWWSTNSALISWSWKRAPSYFDVSTYIGDGATNHNVSHNLGVSPEMIWIKNRGDSTNWVVWHKDLSSGKYLRLETTAAELNQSGILGTASVSATTFPVGSNSDNTNKSSNTYIAYLFASIDGVSKVGSVSHSFNSTTNVDCGFAAGARFVLVKSTASGEWRVWDSVRGIVAGNDPYVHLNDNSAQITNGDLIDPYSGGFALSPGFYTDTYIFYAIA